MKLSSYKIFSISGIDLELHWSFILFILAFLLLDPSFLIILIVIFTFVTLHEFSHSLVAKHYDISVKKILLLPIGGMAQIDTTDMAPWTEIKMSIAGPAFNFAVVGLIFIISSIVGYPLWGWVGEFVSDPTAFSLPIVQLLIFYSFYANLILGAFNLLFPAFPLDGGRVLRASLALRIPYMKATEIAKYVSYMLAGFLFLIGLTGLMLGEGGIWIMIIAVFIGIGASGEYRSLIIHSSLSKINVDHILSRSYPEIYAEETISEGVSKVISSSRSNGIILNDEIGVINLNKLKKIDKEKWSTLPISEVKEEVTVFNKDSSPEDIYRYMTSSGVNPVPVKDDGEIKGVIYLSDIQRVINLIRMVGGIYEAED